MKIRVPERGRSGRSVVTMKNLEFGYGDQVNDIMSYMNTKANDIQLSVSDYCLHNFTFFVRFYLRMLVLQLKGVKNLPLLALMVVERVLCLNLSWV